MTKEKLRELIRSVIREYMGTGSSGGNATDGNDILLLDLLLMIRMK